MLSIYLRKFLPGSTRLPGRAPGPSSPVLGRVVCFLSVFLLVVTISGCSKSSTSQATAGAIAMTDVSGKSVSSRVLALAEKANLSMTPTGDSLNAGVDWKVTCGGNPVTGSITNGACGSLSSAHSADGGQIIYTAPSVIPIGTTVTITATMTSNPSQSSSIVFTVIATPIAVQISTTMPSSLVINNTLYLQAQVSNDPTGAGLYWTAACGSTACGSFSTTTGTNTAYTAPTIVPSGDTVTITATAVADTSKSASAVLTVTNPPTAASITLTLAPTTLYVQTSGSTHTGKFTAVVGNDSSSAGVDWSVSCGSSNCGGITAHTASGGTATFTGPSTVPTGGTVTIKAKSTTDPTVSATATANIVTSAPTVVTMSTTPPTKLVAGATATLAAKVSSDPGKLGVDWTATCGSAGACGSFSLSPAHTASGGQIVYTAPTAVPSGGLVTISASYSATTPSNSAVAFVTISAQPPALSFSQAPPASMVAAAQIPVSVAVTNDGDPGGVTWSVQCGSTVAGACGWISPVQTASGATAIYTAPPVTSTGTSVTIQATSIALSTVSLTSNAIAINPDTTLSVNFVPSLPAKMAPNGTTNLTAAVANGSSDAAVDWQVCPSGCGFFTIRPEVPEIPATTTSPSVPAIPAVTATSVSGWPNGLPIPYTAPTEVPQSGFVTVLASAHADSTKAMSGTISIDSTASGPQLNGVVQAGTQPVAGATVGLYVAGTSGYASAASQIASVTTDKNGNFAIPAGFSCAADNQMYLVATGGAVGSNSANSSLALMTALGSCSGLSSSPMVINEVTTVASAYALAPFAANDVLTGNNSYLYLGTSSGNHGGLANAFASVNNLVDIASGKARYQTPPNNAAAPYVTINTLADILNACTATSGGVEGDGSPCGTLFSATDVVSKHSLYNSVAPTDTLQAIFNIAQHPVTNYGYTLDPAPPVLPALASTSSPFQPILTSQPSDWSLSLNYRRGGGLSSSSSVGSFAVDAGGNLWITDTAAGIVIEWNPTGAAVSSSSGFAAGGGPLAVDSSGNIWISGNGVLTELTSIGTSAQGSPFVGVTGGGSDMVFDAQGDLWISSATGVSEYNSLGAAISPMGGFTNDGITGISSVGIDSSNNVWLGNGSHNNLAELTNPGGQLIVNSTDQNLGTALPQLAADNAGNMWAVTGTGNLCKAPPYAGIGSQLLPTCYPGDSNNSTDPKGFAYHDPGGLAFDGAGTLWVGSTGTGQSPTDTPLLPGVLPISPGLLDGGYPNYLSSSSLSAGPKRVVVDGSGNVWVLLADNSVTEYVGVATPAVTPLALAIKNKKLGAKP